MTLPRAQSCLEWPRLRAALVDGAERDWVLEHVAVCPGCWHQAVQVDPLLAFQNLPDAVVDEGDIESMQERVVGAIRADRAGHGRRHAGMVWLSAAAGVAALVASMAVVWGNWSEPLQMGPLQAGPLRSGGVGPASMLVAAIDAHLEGLPVYEERLAMHGSAEEIAGLDGTGETSVRALVTGSEIDMVWFEVEHLDLSD